MEVQLFERYCWAILEVINSRDFDLQTENAQMLKSIISPGWYATLNCSPFTASFEQQIAVWRNMTLDFPDIYFELVGVDADVNETYRTADVIMHTHMLQGDEKFLTTCMLNFKLSDGKWSWYKHHGIRGIAEVD